MNLFDSLLHSFGTAGTGGFGIKNNSIASYSAYSQWVITVFMLLFGINFNLYCLILIKRVKAALKSTELWCYIGIVATSVIAITVNIATTMANVYGNLSDVVRHSAFQVASIITTSGFSTVDFNLWPEFSKMILVILMFIGGCAGSTAGGLKVSRIMMMFKGVRRNLRQMIHPRSVNSVRFEGKTLDKATLHSVSGYIVVYVIIFFAVMLVLSLEPFNLETTFTATAACFNNIGPGLGAVGPMGSFAGFSDASTWTLSFTMLLGRLEIFPILLTFSPSTWMRK
jgi:trk system potassium uptake protein TrkH